MPVRSAEAQWNGNLREGQGSVKLGSGAFQGPYSFASRFEQGQGTNPEELIGAAHAGCFSMAFAAELTKAGFTPKSVHTSEKVTIDKVGDGFEITRLDLVTEADVPNISEEQFQAIAENAKVGCPVSKALASVQEISLRAKLLQTVQG